MMQSPEFQAQMKKMLANPKFVEHIEKTKQAMQDPEKRKEIEEKEAAALQQGTKALEEAEKKMSPLKKEAEGEDEDDMQVPNLNLN